MNILVLMLGGSGSRLSKVIHDKKQFFPLKKEHELFLCTYKAMKRSIEFNKTIFVIDLSDQKRYEEILNRENIHDVIFVPNGSTREESVNNALRYASADFPDDSYLFIQDGDRPFPDKKALEEIERQKNLSELLFPYQKVLSSVYSKEENRYLNRDELLLVSTPQVASLAFFKEIFGKEEGNLAGFTDEGSLALAAKKKIRGILEESDDFKVTDVLTLEKAKERIKNEKHSS